MADITTYTTTDEVSAIYAAYTDATGHLDQVAIETAIASGDESVAPLEDLVTAYVQLTGNLTPQMMAPEAFFPDIASVAYLWEETSVNNLTQLGDLHSGDTALNDAIEAFLIYGGATPMTSTSSIEADAIAGLTTLTEIEEFLVETTGSAGSTGSAIDNIENFLENGVETIDVEEMVDDDAVLGETFNLFNGADLQEVMSMFIAMGNPGIAMLLYAAYELGPQIKELQDAAVDVMSDGADEMEDILDDMEGLDTQDPETSAEMNALQTQLNQVSQVMQMMQEFIQQAQDTVNQAIQTSSSLSQRTSSTTERLISNIS